MNLKIQRSKELYFFAMFAMCVLYKFFIRAIDVAAFYPIVYFTALIPGIVYHLLK